MTTGRRTAQDPPSGAPAASLQELVCAALSVAFRTRKPMMSAGDAGPVPDLGRIAGRQLNPTRCRMRGHCRYQVLPNVGTPLMPTGQPTDPASALR